LVRDLIPTEVLQGFRSDVECFIAVYPVETGYTLLHADQDCGPFERHLGLRVMHPSQ